MIVLMVRSLTSRTAHRLQRFIHQTTGSEVGWVATDGEVAWQPGAESKITERPLAPGLAAPRGRRPSGGRRSDPLFTDGMLACLKGAFATVLGPNHFGSPQLERPLTTSESERRPAAVLARLANMSQSQAYRFLSAYQKRHFIEVTRDEIRPVRRGEILAEWSKRFRPAVRDATRASTGDVDLDDWLSRTRFPSSVGMRAAIGAHRAAELFGVHATVGAPLTLHIETHTTVFARQTRLEIEPVGGANVLLVPTPYPRAVFDWALPPKGRVSIPSVDLVQCYLDALVHPHRGRELADALSTAFPDLTTDAGET